MKGMILAAALVVIAQSGQVVLAPGPTPVKVQAWCGGAYEPGKGTNFASCDGTSPIESIQSQGDPSGSK